MSCLDEALRVVRVLKDSIVPYRGFSSEVDDTFDDLTEMEGFIEDPSPANVERAMERLRACRGRAEPYRYYPQVQEFLDALSRIEACLKDFKV